MFTSLEGKPNEMIPYLEAAVTFHSFSVSHYSPWETDLNDVTEISVCAGLA